jgi:hypothetical protein
VLVAPNGRVTGKVAEQLIRSVYWDDSRPNKIVVLVDADAKSRSDVENDLRQDLIPRVKDLTGMGLTVLVTSAKWHLESWFLADKSAIEAYLGRSLGSIVTEDPDAVQNPKRHLINLLESQGSRAYTSFVAGEMAESVSPDVLRRRSASFRDLERACLNGPGPQP